ncbi:MAG: acyl carrier protein [Gemmatimonadetes bacterium]|nr:acyl carrier protein [Gemmatimonadota bacterium]
MTDQTRTTPDGIAATVKDFILTEFLPDADPAELTATTPLVTGAILDSLATVRLVAFLEDTYGIQIQAHETSIDHLDSLTLIAELVRSKLA